MAFDATKLGRVSAHCNGNAPHIWSYRNTADASSTIAASGYFNEMALEFTVGDPIWTYGSDGGQWLEGSSNDGTTVAVTVVETD